WGQQGWGQQGWGQQGWGQPGSGQPGWAPGGWAAMPGMPPPKPKPGIIPLRPISLGEIYDGAFQALRTNPRTMIGVSAVVIAVTTLITTLPQAAALTGLGDSAIFSPSRTEPVRPEDAVGPLAGLVTSLLVPSVIQALATTVVTGLLIVAVSGAVL